MEHDELTWSQAVRAGLDDSWCGHDVIIVTCRDARSAALTQARLRHLLGPTPTLLTVQETGRPGNLIGTLLAWRSACQQAHEQGVDLHKRWIDGDLTVALVHNAGLGLRASPLTHAEDNERGALLLPGRLGRQPARLLEAVLAQCAPLACSQVPGQLDVLWSSQLFVPHLTPANVPRIDAPLVKLLTSTNNPDGLADVGTFALDDRRVVDFAAQSTLANASDVERFAAGRQLAVDLGSFRIRHDLIAAMTRRYVDASVQGPRDIDPHFTAPALDHLVGRAPGPYHQEFLDILSEVKGPIISGCDLGDQIPWWRLRRARELRQAALDLRPSCARGEPLRKLLGIDHPIERSWLGNVWIEGPEVSWQDVRDGVVIGAVSVIDSIVHDSSLWAGRTTIRRSVVSHSSGAIKTRDCLIMACGGDNLRASGGLAWRVTDPAPPSAGLAPTYEGLCAVDRPRLVDGRAMVHGFMSHDAKVSDNQPHPSIGLSWHELRQLASWNGPTLASDAWTDADNTAPYVVRDLPAAAIELILDRVPLNSDLHRWASLAAEGVWRLALHRGSRAALPVDGPLVLGRQWHDAQSCYWVHLDLETWQRWQHAPQRLAGALVHAWSESLAAPHPRGRRWWADRRLADWRAGPITPSSLVRDTISDAMRIADVSTILDQVHAWCSLDDPDRTDLGALFNALDHLRTGVRDVRTVAQLRAWLRWRLDHVNDDISTITDTVQLTDPDLLTDVGFHWTHPWLVGERWLPSWDLRPSEAPQGIITVQQLATRIAKLGHRVIGIAGPAAAGKSRLTREICAALKANDASVTNVSADTLTWRGPGFRYLQLEDLRHTHLWGPGIYDDLGICH
ncbi:MAG: hypothetical protein ACI9MC_002850, partial [Kiritimatiellia bacterium]